MTLMIENMYTYIVKLLEFLCMNKINQINIVIIKKLFQYCILPAV